MSCRPRIRVAPRAPLPVRTSGPTPNPRGQVEVIDDPEIPPVGVTVVDPSTARFRVWAPKAKAVELVLGSDRLAMEPEPRGFFALTRPMPEVGARYAYALD